MSAARDAAPIFVTIGTQLAFRRLLDAMDALAPSLDRPVIAQAGPDARGGAARWSNLEIAGFLDGAAFSELAGRAHLIVGHAGIGTVLTARSFGKPLILVPRRSADGEHRNDHQTATARHLEGRPGIAVAWEMEDLAALLASPPAPPETEGEVPAPLAALRSRVSEFVSGL